MTGAEMERAVEFLLESHASLTAKVDKLTENQLRNEASIERMQASIERLAEEAAADRSEVRAAVNTMLAFAESMADNVNVLTKVQQATTKRMDRAEARLDDLEQSDS